MPPSGKSGGGAPSRSFKEVLLAAASVVSSDSVSAPPASPLCSTSPRILLRPADSRQPPSRRSLDAGGRQEVESQRSRKTRLRAEREQRRRVPADLRGLCFNYFSPNHRVGACNNRTRCFKCWLTGRRAYWCPFFGMATHPLSSFRPPGADRLHAAVWRRRDTGLPASGGGDGVGGDAALTPPAAC